MIYIKAFVGNAFWRQCYTLDIKRVRRKTYYTVKAVKGF